MEEVARPHTGNRAHFLLFIPQTIERRGEGRIEEKRRRVEERRGVVDISSVSCPDWSGHPPGSGTGKSDNLITAH